MTVLVRRAGEEHYTEIKGGTIGESGAVPARIDVPDADDGALASRLRAPVRAKGSGRAQATASMHREIARAGLTPRG